MPPDDNISFFNSQRTLQRLNRTTLNKGGTISCNSPVTSGSASVCTLTPDTGWYVAALSDNGDVLSQLSGNKYTITNITANHDVSVTYQEYFVRRVSADNSTTDYYTKVQGAFDKAVNGDKIRLLDMTFPETLTFNKPSVSILLEGGYASGFANNTGYSLLGGKLVIQNGKVIMRQIKVK